MPVYMVVTAALKDREAFLAGYAPAAAALVSRSGGRYVFRGRGATLLEGGWGDGASVLISEWPDRETAERFWSSPDYAAVKALRDGLADVQVLLLEGQSTLPPASG